jgi:hypothetical protein
VQSRLPSDLSTLCLGFRFDRLIDAFFRNRLRHPEAQGNEMSRECSNVCGPEVRTRAVPNPRVTSLVRGFFLLKFLFLVLYGLSLFSPFE